MSNEMSYEGAYDIAPKLSWINEIQFKFNRCRILREYCVILCGAGLKGQENQVRNIEEYTLSKYGDILGS